MSATKILYAAVGAGDLAIEKARNLAPANVRRTLPKRLTKVQDRIGDAGTKAVTGTFEMYSSLVNRGEKTVRSIRNAAPTKRAVAQSKNATSQTKAAVTSSQKAASATATAVKEAATS